MAEYTQEWYDYIDSLVFKYQDGDSEAAWEIIKAFKLYLSKFFLILREGKINLDDKDSRRFIILFISEPNIRFELKKPKQSAIAQAKAHGLASYLQYKLEVVADEDIEQELIEALLILAKRYKKKGKKRNFAGYVYNAYRYEAYRKVNGMLRDPIVFSKRANMCYNDGENITEKEDVPLYFIDAKEMPSVIGDELSTNWIYGLTCGDVFSHLTPFERLILKLYYADGLFDHEIATKTGYHRNWISRKRRKAVKDIARRMGYAQDD